ncbi:MAG: c-type cytochrome [Sterolibacterium sp.]
MNALHHRMKFGFIAATLATLTACGGGGGDGSTGTNPAANATIRGVAATGSAIANGQVSLKCSVGSTSAVNTQTDGSYSVDVSQVTLPCVARVDYLDATTHKAEKLHSLVQAVGTVNITPVTDLLVANLSSTGVAADAYDKFDANEVKTYSAERVQTAGQMVKTELKSRGVDVTHLPDDAIGAKLVATSGSGKGDAHDDVLDEIKDKLEEQGKTLHDLEHDMKSGHETRGLTTTTGQAGDAAKGKVAYEANCKSCHGTRISDAINAAKILSAIRENEGGMGSLSTSISSTVADDIATYMASTFGTNAGTVPATTLKTQTISFSSPGNQTIGVATPALSATASSGLPVTITSSTAAVCTVANGALTLVAAGTCSLNATQSGNSTYNAAATVVNTFTVASASGAVLPKQTITFASVSAQKVGTPVTLTASSDSGLAVSLASTTPTICTLSGNILTPVAAGDCTITANQAGNSSFAAAATVTRTFAVTNPTAAVSATNGKALYASKNCGGCHGTPPSRSNVLNGANNPTVINSAIARDTGGMGMYSGMTSPELADIAAYLATPNI